MKRGGEPRGEVVLYRSDYAIEYMYIVCFIDGFYTMLLIMNISLHRSLRYTLDLV